MDFLDEMIERHRAEDPEFAEAWAKVERRLNLALLRKNAGLTQQQVAEKMNVARPRVAEMERRPESVSLARMIAYADAIDADIVIVPRDKSKGALATALQEAS